MPYGRIIEVGPQFTLSGSLGANFAVQNITTSVEVNYDFGGASYAFPQPETLSNTNGIMSSSDRELGFYTLFFITPLYLSTRRVYLTNFTSITEVTFSAKPGFGATLNATTHLISQVSLGLKALGGAVSANVYLNVDGSIVLQGNASSATNTTQACLNGKADIIPEVGAHGSFFKIFSETAAVPLTNKQFALFDVRALCTFFFRMFIILSTEMLYMMECGEIGGGVQTRHERRAHVRFPSTIYHYVTADATFLTVATNHTRGKSCGAHVLSPMQRILPTYLPLGLVSPLFLGHVSLTTRE